MRRRLFIGDLHGCADELAELLRRFGHSPASDTLFCVGDVVGKGPKPRQTLELLRRLGAGVTLGNHDAFCLDAAAAPEDRRSESQHAYLAMLGEGKERETLLAQMASWPLYLEQED